MKIQVGRTYIDGEGTRCHIVEYDASVADRPFRDEHGCRYAADGAYRSAVLDPGTYPELDLLREEADPEELREEIAELRREVAELRELVGTFTPNR